ncbi:MAG: PEP-CTERM sorting domain-containing protein [Sedimentisphaerales bacterium]|nr:PEP-CTERM sorting domain-containing protein [Sedimentisphaerales bacterium]
MKRITTTICIMLMVVLVSNAKANLTDGLVACYPFNGNADDESGNTNHGTVYGATLTTDRFGNPNRAYSFDGENDYVAIPDSSVFDFGTGDFSISIWFKTGYSGEQYIVDFKQDDNFPHIEIYNGGIGGFGTHIEPGNDRITLGSTINDNKWHHVTITLDNGASDGYKLYLDGTKKGERTASVTLSDWDTLTIGVRSHSSGTLVSPFNGLIDDARFYNRNLDATEVTELYTIPEPATLFLLGLGTVILRKKY